MNVSRDGASAICLGNLLQHSTTLMVKNFLLMSQATAARSRGMLGLGGSCRQHLLQMKWMQARNATFVASSWLPKQRGILHEAEVIDPAPPSPHHAFHLTPAAILLPAPVSAVVVVSSARSQLLNQWPEISHWQPQVAERFPLVLCIWAVVIISAVITAATGGCRPEWHFVVLGTVQRAAGSQC